VILGIGLCKGAVVSKSSVYIIKKLGLTKQAHEQKEKNKKRYYVILPIQLNIHQRLVENHQIYLLS
jgi:hypothetical protein